MGDIFHDVACEWRGLHGAGFATHVHQDQWNFAARCDFGEARIVIEAGDVVEDLRSEAESNFSYLGFTGVERDGDFEFAAKSLQRWKEPAEFFVGGDA